MTVEAFRDALAKGLGRAALALQREDPAPYLDALVEACVVCRQYDRSFEAIRAPYLAQTIGLARAQTAVYDAILAAPEDESRDAAQRTEILGEYVRRGSERAWEVLRERAQRGDGKAQDALALSGERGLAWVAEQIFPKLSERDAYRVGWWLPIDAEDDATSTQRRLRAWVVERDARREASRPAPAPPAPSPPASARAFLDSLEDPGNLSSSYDFAQAATAGERTEAAERFLTATDPRVVRALGDVFRRHDWPLSPLRLIEAAAEKTRKGVAHRMLGRIDAPEVRTYGLDLLQRRPLPWNAFETLGASFRPGDETVIESALRATEGETVELLHNAVHNLTTLLETRPEGAWQPAAEWAYERSPCALCRERTVDWMLDQGTVPLPIREEGVWDAQPGIRQAVAV